MEERELFKVDTHLKVAPHKFTALGLVVLRGWTELTLLTQCIAHRFPPHVICSGGMIFIRMLLIAESTFSGRQRVGKWSFYGDAIQCICERKHAFPGNRVSQDTIINASESTCTYRSATACILIVPPGNRVDIP